jgi:enolase-phosphatase E1
MTSTTGIRAILLDIEGTTTPISFVHDVLFGFARSHLRDYLTQHTNSEDLLADLVMLREEHAASVARGEEPPPLEDEIHPRAIDSVVQYVGWLMDRDRKSSGLKSLQGKIWRQGYLDGLLRAPLFADVPPAFKRWHSAGINISIFSSGSTLAQELLFGHTETGDLAIFISNYFDTRIGKKTDVESYRRIAATLALSPPDVLFISDVVGELDAAREAGMKTLLAVRPGNSPLSAEVSHATIRSFDEIRAETSPEF